MPASLPDRFHATPRKVHALRSETGSQAACDERLRWGRAIERALAMSNITKQEAAFAMGYGENQAPISRWCSGDENPQMARLTAALGKGFERNLIVAYASDAEGVTVETTIKFQREATA